MNVKHLSISQFVENFNAKPICSIREYVGENLFRENFNYLLTLNGSKGNKSSLNHPVTKPGQYTQHTLITSNVYHVWQVWHFCFGRTVRIELFHKCKCNATARERAEVGSIEIGLTNEVVLAKLSHKIILC